MFEVVVTIRAEVHDVLDLDDLPENSIGDPQRAISDLLAEMEDLDPQELADEVHEEYRYLLCPACRQRMHRGLKQRALSRQAPGVADATAIPPVDESPEVD